MFVPIFVTRATAAMVSRGTHPFRSFSAKLPLVPTTFHETLEFNGPDGKSMFRDRLAVSIYRDELESKALRMMKIARAALVYVVCAVNVEEHMRSTKRGKGRVSPMFMDKWEDAWKF